MSRRARIRHAAREAKTAEFFRPGGRLDDEGGIDVDQDPRCYVCGALESSTDSGCCGIGGEVAECPRR